MLNFDGITIIDNKGQIRAYNVFVEPNAKRVGYIVGGARKRAAYYILSGKRKGIVGVYCQSHEGEVFFQSVGKTQNNKKPKKEKKIELAQPKAETLNPEISPANKQTTENTPQNPSTNG